MSLLDHVSDAAKTFVEQLRTAPSPEAKAALIRQHADAMTAELWAGVSSPVADRYFTDRALAEMSPDRRAQVSLFDSAGTIAYGHGAYEDALEVYTRAQEVAPKSWRRDRMKRIKDVLLARRDGLPSPPTGSSLDSGA